MIEPDNKTRFWQIFAAATFVAIAAAAIRWSWLHPYGTHWDEAQYLDEVAIDAQRLRAGLLIKVAGRILMKSWGRPPAYRLLADPVLAVTGFHTMAARLVTLACFSLSVGYLYLATKRIAGEMAGAFSVLIFCLAPQVVSASMWFSSEGPLYLAVSAMFYYLFSIWTDEPERSKNWIGLGFACGLGLLAKSSFVLIGMPVLVFALLAGRWKALDISKSLPIMKAGGLALLIAAPWWVLNLKPSIAYAAYARGFVRNSLGSPSPATWMRWFDTVLESLLGYALSLVIFAIVIAFVRQSLLQKTGGLTALQKAAIGACACAGLPIVAAQLLGTNHLLRHISPSMIPLAIVIGIFARSLEWMHSWAAVAVFGSLFLAQFVMLVAPLFVPNQSAVDPGLKNGSLPWRIMDRYDQWDWSQLQSIAAQCGIQDPKISYLGDGRAFNQPGIQFPWAAKGSSADVTWLWRYEDGPIDWQKITDEATQSDLVITAPKFVGAVSDGEDLDNQHNAEFAEKLESNPRFQGPIRLGMGRFQPVEVLVFANKSLTCKGAAF